MGAGGPQARFEVPLQPETAPAVHQALMPEADEGPEGSVIRLQRDGSTIVIDIEAPDVSTLRAAMHSMLRLLDAAHATVEPAHKKA